MKLHYGLDADGHLPVFMDLRDGKTHDLECARPLDVPRGSCLVFDRGYTITAGITIFQIEKSRLLHGLKVMLKPIKLAIAGSLIQKMFYQITILSSLIINEFIGK